MIFNWERGYKRAGYGVRWVLCVSPGVEDTGEKSGHGGIMWRPV